ncbi:pimeloyl-ACP methyl ester carboxylesterase [Microbacterium sp. AG1240]|uniref:alpha/beta fold hydrolase n=1 Tax=Microbacterium sp. AG1240 TaxID=2183992 RepID=UPI000EB12E95|nr:alpha/beta hydrolase [Microbacterium sp. AG1240]RKT36506.1 pimeloyl-ACP methyl ester carboxylesterase [Microbacterium sp. AG1240]
MTISAPQTFEPDGRSIPFVDEGEGHLLVLLPGQGLSIASLGTLAHVLEEEGFRILRIGVRAQAPDTAPVTLHDLGHDVVDVLDHLGIGQAWIGGHGFGSTLARVIARDHADRVEGLVLLGVEGSDPVSAEVSAALDSAFAAQTAAEAKDAMRVLAGEAVDADFAWNVFSRLRDDEARALQAAARAATPVEDWEPLAERIPVNIIQGTHDRIDLPETAEKLRATAPTRASLASIEGGGYLAVITHPGEIGAEIEDYLGWD